MEDACHPDTIDRSTGCFGISGTLSDDQSWSPGFMVVVVHALTDLGARHKVCVAAFGIIRISARIMHNSAGWKSWHSYSRL